MGKIPKTTRHKKLKSVGPSEDDKQFWLDRAPMKFKEQTIHRKVVDISLSKGVLAGSGGKIRPKHKGGLDGDARVGLSFSRLKNESQKQFRYRVEKETQCYISNKKSEDKFGVNLEDNARKLRESERKLLSMSKTNMYREQVISKGKTKRRKQKKKKVEEYDVPKDEVQFGEVAHAPPTVKVIPRHAKVDTEARPFARDPKLKLSFLLNQKAQASVGKEATTYDSKSKESGDIERERERAVEAYRKLKADRHKARLSVPS